MLKVPKCWSSTRMPRFAWRRNRGAILSAFSAANSIRIYSISGMSLPAEAAYTLDCTDPWEPLGAPHEGIPAKAWDGPSRLLRVFTCGAPSGSRALTGRLRPVFGQKIGRNLGDSQRPGRRGRDAFCLTAIGRHPPAAFHF